MNDQIETYVLTSSSLRIAVFAHALRVAGGLSIGHNLLAALGRVAPQHTYFVTIPAGLGYEEICIKIPNCEALPYRHKGGWVGRWFFDTFRLTRLVKEFLPDVIFAMGKFGLLNPPCLQAVLVHWPYLFYPRKHYGRITLKGLLRVLVERQRFARQLSKTQLVFCPTPVIESRLKEIYKFTGKTAICPNAVSAFVLEGEANTAIPGALAGYAGKFELFCLTKFYSHKNLESLVNVFRKYPVELNDVIVVVTVSPDQSPNASGFIRSIEKYGLANHIINVGPLTQSDLAGYYKCCHALLLPTLLEVFSVTYLEAMHFGLPILTSDLDFARSVCGDAALYFDPWDTESIKNAILRLKNDPLLGNELVSKGKSRIRNMFRSWDDIARDTIYLLEKIAQPGTRKSIRK